MGCKVIHKTVMALSCTLLLTAWTAPAPAQESNEKAAREMVEGVLRNTEKSRTGDLGAWSRGVIKRALKRTGENTSQTPAPLPAEAQADRLAGSLSTPARGPEVIVFMSLSQSPRQAGGNGAWRRRGQASRSSCAASCRKGSRPP